jgi:hypothetical protein
LHIFGGEMAMPMAVDIDEKVSQPRQGSVDAGAHADAEKRSSRLRGDSDHIIIGDNGTDSQGSDCPAREVERWNYPRSNVYKTFATFWAFLVMGANDSAYGVRSLSYLESRILLIRC